MSASIVPDSSADSTVKEAWKEVALAMFSPTLRNSSTGSGVEEVDVPAPPHATAISKARRPRIATDPALIFAAPFSTLKKGVSGKVMEEVSRDLRLMPSGMARIVAQALYFVKKSRSAAKY